MGYWTTRGLRGSELEDTINVTNELYLEKKLRSEEHTSELQTHYSITYAVFCLKKKIPISFLERVYRILLIKNNNARMGASENAATLGVGNKT